MNRALGPKASLAASAGPAWIAIGHSKSGFTRDTYTSVLPPGRPGRRGGSRRHGPEDAP